MPFFTRCPYCRRGVRAPDRALAGSVKCPGCASWYTAVAEKEPEPAAVPKPSSSPLAPRAAGARTEASSSGGVSTASALEAEPAPLLEFLETPSGTPPAADEPAGAGRPPLSGVAACLLAGAALVASSMEATAPLTWPLALVGLVFGLVGAVAAAGGRPIRLVLPALGGLVSGGVLVVALAFPALLGPQYEASREVTVPRPDVARAVPLKLTAGGADGLESDGYADASRAAVQQGGFRVRVAAAAVGPAQVVDSQKRYTKQPFLAVTVQIQHLGSAERVRLVHWGTTGERAVPEATATADGRPLATANLAGEVPFGVSFGRELFPGETATDLLLFDPPAPGAAVRLDLPAEAWGGRGAFRFQIPSSMVTIQPGAQPR